MLHLLSPPIRIATYSPLPPQNVENEGAPPLPWTANQRRKASYRWIVLFLTLVLAMIRPSSLLALDNQQISQEDQKSLQDIHTILVTGTARTWLDAPTPPYKVGVTLKIKLEDAGFQVVFHPSQPHDANLRIQYEEIPNGQFKVLEQGTAIRYRMQLMHEGRGEIFSHDFEAQPNPIPLKSLYWDAIANLEEDPYYCFVGDLIWGQIHQGQNAQDILLEVLLRPLTRQNLVNSAGARGANQAIVQQRARLNIIQELGKGVFHTPEAQEALWAIASKAQANERVAALTQLGKIGDSSFLSPLAKLMEKEGNPEVRSAAKLAIRLIESQRPYCDEHSTVDIHLYVVQHKTLPMPETNKDFIVQ